MRRTFAALSTLCLAAAALADAPATTRAVDATTRHAAIADKGEPLVALWAGGIYMLGTESRVIAAAWPDGTVVREVSHRMLPGVPVHDANGRTVGSRTPIAQTFRIGRVAPADVRSIEDAADRAGVRDLRSYGSVATDGPFEIFVLTRGGASITRMHDRGFDRAPRRGVVDENDAKYAELWRTAVETMRTLKADDERTLDGPLGLTLPRERE